MDFANILQSMKNKKSVKTLTFWVALDSLRTVWQVFDTFFCVHSFKESVAITLSVDTQLRPDADKHSNCAHDQLK